MDPYQSKRMNRYQKNGVSLFVLVMLGCGIIFFGIVQMACSFVVNYADDFETSDGDGLEAKVQSELSYAQYWAGIPYLVTGLLVVCSGIFQRARGLTVTAVIFGIGSIFITFFVVVLDGGNWHTWNTMYRNKLYWDSKRGYDCSTDYTESKNKNKCMCKMTPEVDTTNKEISKYKCSEVDKLSSLYGAVVGSSIVVAFLCTFAVLVIAKSLSWKQMRHAQSYRDYWNDDNRVDNGRGRVPSVIDLPYGKRGPEYEDRPLPPAGPPHKQSIYRNYPY